MAGFALGSVPIVAAIVDIEVVDPVAVLALFSRRRVLVIARVLVAPANVSLDRSQFVSFPTKTNRRSIGSVANEHALERTSVAGDSRTVSDHVVEEFCAGFHIGNFCKITDGYDYSTPT